MIQLAKSGDGRVVIASNQAFPSHVQRVEYYRDLKLCMLVFEDDDNGERSDLMPCEVEDHAAQLIQQSPDAIIIEKKEGAGIPFGYIAPLVQIGL
jgi:hypothetical protein